MVLPKGIKGIKYTVSSSNNYFARFYIFKFGKKKCFRMGFPPYSDLFMAIYSFYDSLSLEKEMSITKILAWGFTTNGCGMKYNLVQLKSYFCWHKIAAISMLTGVCWHFAPLSRCKLLSLHSGIFSTLF